MLGNAGFKDEKADVEILVAFLSVAESEKVKAARERFTLNCSQRPPPRRTSTAIAFKGGGSAGGAD